MHEKQFHLEMQSLFYSFIERCLYLGTKFSVQNNYDLNSMETIRGTTVGEEVNIERNLAQ